MAHHESSSSSHKEANKIRTSSFFSVFLGEKLPKKKK
jgi:hypothetical protein